MRALLLVFVSLMSFSCGQQFEGASEIEGEEGHAKVFTPEEEEAFFKQQLQFPSKATRFKFEQTKWLECQDDVTGNYTGYNCTNRRGISVILRKFMQTHFLRCANEGLKAQGLPKAIDMHVTHAGILGDPNHSSKSLHSESRAIDVRSMEVEFEDGRSKNLIYKGTANRTLYIAFRKCWARTVMNYNECPLYNGSLIKTGSIGWEDSRHRSHMHVSVPYCYNNKYGPGFWRR